MKNPAVIAATSSVEYTDWLPEGECPVEVEEAHDEENPPEDDHPDQQHHHHHQQQSDYYCIS